MATFIQKERAQNKLNIDKINAFLDPDHENTQRIFREIINDPVLVSSKEIYDLTKPELRELCVKKIQRLSSYIDGENFEDFEKRLGYLAIPDPSLTTRIGINLSLFCNAIKGNGTDAQIKYWLHERGTLKLRDIYGCFAMTELGHGSNVPGLQTIATYNPDRETFTINTPNLQATKWWIGGAAHSSNHAVVYARLISKGKDYGVKIFVVQLRDKQHNLLPGVTLGDIGSKMGRDAIDNGWIQFYNVEVPREYMLQKFTTIDADGTVHLTPLEQLSYSALLQGRVTMVSDSFKQGARAAIIALRYAIGRQQFGDLKNENQIINYALHQYRLVPYLAIIYLLGPGSQRVQAEYKTILTELYAGKNIKKTIFDMKNLFVNSASLKASSTWLTSQLIDEARQACGGHGYHAYSGLGRAFNDWSVQQTWEGDNNVLSINAGRSIIKYYDAGQKGGKLGDDFLYLKQKFDKNLKLDSLQSLIDIWSDVIIKVSQHTLTVATGDWENVSQERLLLSKFHAYRYLLVAFLERLESGQVSGEEKTVLEQLYRLFSYFFIDKFAGTFLQFGILDASKLSFVQGEVKKILSDLRPNLVGLTDAFKYPDELINSSLGNYDGEFYKGYFKDVTTHNGKGDKAPYTDLLEGMLTRPSQDELLSNSRSKATLKQFH